LQRDKLKEITKTLRAMKNSKNSIADTIKKKVKIRLDHKTIITLKDMTRFDYWKNLYPNAVIIS